MPVQNVLLTVGLKVTDNEALSALEAIQVKMGLGERVRDLRREELWEIEVDAETLEAAAAAVEGLVATTNIFANPNKHSHALAPRGEAPGAQDLDGDEVAVLVSERESGEGESVLHALERIGVPAVRSLRRWTRWRIRLDGPPSRDDDELLPLIRRIGVATGRHDGLLSNPHSQISRAALPWGEELTLDD